MQLMRTRGEMLARAISFALGNAVKVVRGLRKGLTSEERYEVANRVIEETKQHGDPWRLNEDETWDGPAAAQTPTSGRWTPEK
jgi:hypothetical protein